MPGDDYLCFDMACTFNSTAKRNLYIYLSRESWMKLNITKMYPSSSVAEAHIHREQFPGIQIASQEEHYFDHVHNHDEASDCLSNFFFQDWVMCVLLAATNCSLRLMDKYVCPNHVLICLLTYAQSSNEPLKFSSPYAHHSNTWKDTKFVIFPIFDDNGSAKNIGFVSPYLSLQLTHILFKALLLNIVLL
jgi:hypothetical protein